MGTDFMRFNSRLVSPLFHRQKDIQLVHFFKKAVCHIALFRTRLFNYTTGMIKECTRLS
jgi:hypothetical protein